ncbi:MAG: aldehyde dehydrogenase family protein [Acidimicrobiia bacterium]
MTDLTDNAGRFYIGGRWTEPASSETFDVIDPATEQPVASVAAGTASDIDAATAAAKDAFASFSSTTTDDRLALLERIIAAYRERAADLAHAVHVEMGAPLDFATKAQVPAGLGNLVSTRRALADFAFESVLGTTLVVREPIGVCGLITPWNWPLNQITSKVAPALAAGCTMVLKPSEVAPLDAILFAEIMDAAGVPPGVFNMVNGPGAVIGPVLAGHPDIDMISITGSTRAGVDVALNAAPTVKRVAQELGGKSANIVLDGADLAEVITRDVAAMLANAGQSCAAGTRLLVPSARMDEAAAIARAAAEGFVAGQSGDGRRIGPVASRAQYDRVQGYIESGIAEGARLDTGGLDRPEGRSVGFYVRPTVFSRVTPQMTIAREEIFGPVLVIIGYEDEDHAVAIANDSAFGLSGYVSGEHEHARSVARRIRTGMVHLNGAPPDIKAPFGGYKQSGNGREWGRAGIEEFLETKSIFGALAAP